MLRMPTTIKIRKKKSQRLNSSFYNSELLESLQSQESSMKPHEYCSNIPVKDELYYLEKTSIEDILNDIMKKSDCDLDTATKCSMIVIGSLETEVKLEKNKIFLKLKEAEMMKEKFDWECQVLKEELEAVKGDIELYESYICNEHYYNFKNATWDTLKNVGRDELLLRRTKLQEMKNDLNEKYQMLWQHTRIYHNLLTELNTEEIKRDHRSQLLSLRHLLDNSEAILAPYMKKDILKSHITEDLLFNKIKQDVKDTNTRDCCPQRNVLKVQELGCTFDFVLQHRVNRGGSPSDYKAVAGIFLKEIPVFKADKFYEGSEAFIRDVFSKQNSRLQKEKQLHFWLYRKINSSTADNPNGLSVPNATCDLKENDSKPIPEHHSQLEKDGFDSKTASDVLSNNNTANDHNVVGSLPSEKALKENKHENCEKGGSKDDVGLTDGNSESKKKKMTKKKVKQTKSLEEKTDEIVKATSEMKEVVRSAQETLDFLKADALKRKKAKANSENRLKSYQNSTDKSPRQKKTIIPQIKCLPEGSSEYNEKSNVSSNSENQLRCCQETTEQCSCQKKIFVPHVNELIEEEPSEFNAKAKCQFILNSFKEKEGSASSIHPSIPENRNTSSDTEETGLVMKELRKSLDLKKYHKILDEDDDFVRRAQQVLYNKETAYENVRSTTESAQSELNSDDLKHECNQSKGYKDPNKQACTCNDATVAHADATLLENRSDAKISKNINEGKRLALLNTLKNLHDFMKRGENIRDFVQREELELSLIPVESLSTPVILQFLKKVVLKLRHLDIWELKKMETKDLKLRDISRALLCLDKVIPWEKDDDISDGSYSSSCSSSSCEDLHT